MTDHDDSGSRPTVPSDAELMTLVRAGERAAFEELFRRHADAVRRHALAWCRDEHVAQDLTAEVFARTLRAVARGAGPDTQVRAYLLTSVRRVAATWAASAGRTRLVDDFAALPERAVNPAASGDLVGPGAEVAVLHTEEQSLAMRALLSLPERWQLVLWHTLVLESAPRDVAPLLGISPNAVSVLAMRATEGLKQAYLQSHVALASARPAACAKYADRLGAHARGALGRRAERGLGKHLKVCGGCRAAADEIRDVGAGLPALAPIAVYAFSPAELDYLASLFGTTEDDGR